MLQGMIWIILHPRTPTLEKMDANTESEKKRASDCLKKQQQRQQQQPNRNGTKQKAKATTAIHFSNKR